jgi:hypothetical protein
VATASATEVGKALDVVKGPDESSGTTHASARKVFTVRVTSLWKLLLIPVMTSARAKTRPVATIPIAKRRRRHCRSRRLAISMSASSPSRPARTLPTGQQGAVLEVAAATGRDLAHS